MNSSHMHAQQHTNTLTFPDTQQLLQDAARLVLGPLLLPALITCDCEVQAVVNRHGQEQRRKHCWWWRGGLREGAEGWCGWCEKGGKIHTRVKGLFVGSSITGQGGAQSRGPAALLIERPLCREINPCLYSLHAQALCGSHLLRPMCIHPLLLICFCNVFIFLTNTRSMYM